MIPDEMLDRWEAQVKAGRDGSSNVPALIAEVRELRAELSRTSETARKLFVETRDLRIRAEQAEDQVRGFQQMRWPEEAHRLQQQLNEARRIAETAEAELARIRTLLTDDGTVETVPRHLLPYDAARAALTRFGRLTGLIGGEENDPEPATDVRTVQ